MFLTPPPLFLDSVLAVDIPDPEEELNDPLKDICYFRVSLFEVDVKSLAQE